MRSFTAHFAYREHSSRSIVSVGSAVNASIAGQEAERARDEGLARADGGENGDARDVDDFEAERSSRPPRPGRRRAPRSLSSTELRPRVNAES